MRTLPRAVPRPVGVTAALLAGSLLVASCGLSTSSTKTKTTAAPGSSSSIATIAPGSTPQTAFPTIPVPSTSTTAQVGAAATVAGSPVAAAPTNTSIPKPGEKYIVKSGDALDIIALAMNVKVEDLMAENGITAAGKNLIKVGQQLIVPEGGFMPPGGSDAEGPAATYPGQTTTTAGPGGTTTAGSTAYTVKSGDTWIGIASKAGIKVDALLAFNNANQSSVLQVGQTIRIPKKTAENTATTVKASATTVKATTTTKKPVTTTTKKPATTTTKPATTTTKLPVAST